MPNDANDNENENENENEIDTQSDQRTHLLNGAVERASVSVNGETGRRKPPLPEGSLERLWSLFPRKVGKAKALNLLERAIRDFAREEEFELDEYNGQWTLQARYETAWCPPTKLIQKLSELFPTLVFHTTFDEESQAFVGCEIFFRGKEFSAGFEPGTAEVPEGYAERWNAIQDKFASGDDDAFQDLLDYQSDLKDVAEGEALEAFRSEFPTISA